MSAPGRSDHRPLSLMLVAVEPSGDALGAELITSLRRHYGGDIRFCGCGGALMAQAGFDSAFAIERLSVMGVSDVARVYPQARRRVRELADLALRMQVDGVIFIDGWAFSRLGAKQIRTRAPDMKIFKYAAPQIWASRPRRIDFVRDYFDGVLTLLPFEAPLFSAAGVRARFVGNPVFQRAWQEAQAATGIGERFRTRHHLGDDCVLVMLPGSRAREVSMMADPFRRTLELLHQQIRNLKIVVPVAPAVASQVRRAFGDDGRIIFVDSDEKYPAFIAGDGALAVSGTVTTELAICATPLVVTYRVDPITAIWAKHVLKTPFASILNVMAGTGIIAEFLQDQCQPALIADALLPLLTDKSAAAAQAAALRPILARLSLEGPPASDITAKTVLEWLD